MVFGILKRVQPIVKRGLQAISAAISRLTKPRAHGPVVGTVADLARNKPQLVTENLLLRQQLLVLNRSIKRPLSWLLPSSSVKQAHRGLYTRVFANG